MTDPPKIFPLGDNALTIDFGNKISLGLNHLCVSLAAHFSNHPFSGFIEAAPAYSSLSIFYDVVEVRRRYPEHASAFDAVRSLVGSALENISPPVEDSASPVEIPVDFTANAAPDLDLISRHSGLAPDRVIEVFTSRIYRVYMIGFLPGFPYMAEVDRRIAVPRRESPRLKVPRGSVGIAGTQTGIYPFESPGGWQLIGRTEIEMFTPSLATPSRLKSGDSVRFVRAK